jgi:DNA-binding CsgD family transcriptional regulator/sugar-specific transcriptional regulator TrmB
LKNALDMTVLTRGEQVRTNMTDGMTAVVGGRAAAGLATTASGLAVDEMAIRVYEQTLAYGRATVLQVAAALRVPAPQVEKAMESLLAVRLVKYCEVENRYRAASPDAVQVEQSVPLEEAIHDKCRELAGIQEQLRSFADSFSSLNRPQLRRDAVVSYQDQTQVELRMAEATRNCTSEILAMQPVDQRRDLDFKPSWLKEIPPGIPVRVLYSSTVRTSQEAWGDLREVAGAGARIRTSDGVFDRLVIVGDEVAFMPDHTAGKDGQAVTIVYEPAVISLLRRVYEYAWQSGSDFDADGVSDRETLDELKGTILDLLASGLKDDVVARRIGMSSRTFRRHMSRLMGELEAQSRFQAGVAAARAGLVGMNESLPPVARPA